jgi:cytochrome c551/c552
LGPRERGPKAPARHAQSYPSQEAIAPKFCSRLRPALERQITLKIAGFGVVMLVGAFALGASAVIATTAKQTRSGNGRAHASAADMLTDAQISRMSSHELAKWVFDHHGCTSCHTLSANGKFGFTERGKQVGKGFEGCISLLTAMSAIAQVKPKDRTAKMKNEAAHFQRFGCTTCHQIMPGKIGLTSYGTKLKSLHMACTDVERILTQRR